MSNKEGETKLLNKSLKSLKGIPMQLQLFAKGKDEEEIDDTEIKAPLDTSGEDDFKSEVRNFMKELKEKWQPETENKKQEQETETQGKATTTNNQIPQPQDPIQNKDIIPPVEKEEIKKSKLREVLKKLW